MYKSLCFLLFLFLCTVARAAGSEEAIRASIERSKLGAEINYIKSGPMPGIYTVGLVGGRLFYASEDGEYFIQGRIFKAGIGSAVNLTDQEERLGIAAAVEGIPGSKKLIFPAKGKALAKVTVFTDTSCPFCRHLHEDIQDINEAGVSVEYLAFPREGLESDASRVMESVWCSKDKLEAFSRAVKGKSIPVRKCDSPVAEQFILGQKIGVQGTPAIVFQDGLVVSGYRPVAQLIEAAKRAAGVK